MRKKPTRKLSYSTTGNPGSVIVPQYGSSKITVFVWGKNITLEFLSSISIKYFLNRGGWLWATDVSVPRKVTPEPPGWIFFVQCPGLIFLAAC